MRQTLILMMILAPLYGAAAWLIWVLAQQLDPIGLGFAFAGVVAEVPVALGDMAMPGRPLLTLYDPSALRVAAAVPQSVSRNVVITPPG